MTGSWLPSKSRVLYRRVTDPRRGACEQLVVPSPLRQQVLSSLHRCLGHQGFPVAADSIRPHAYWPGVYMDLEQSLASCADCRGVQSSTSSDDQLQLPVLAGNRDRERQHHHGQRTHGTASPEDPKLTPCQLILGEVVAEVPGSRSLDSAAPDTAMNTPVRKTKECPKPFPRRRIPTPASSGLDSQQLAKKKPDWIIRYEQYPENNPMLFPRHLR